MNMFEAEIAKYERRLRKIEESPDPTLLKSNKLLYELYRAERIEELEMWKAGKPVVYFAGMRDEIFEAMGLHVLRLDLLADRMAGQATKYFQTARSSGYSGRSLCDRIQVALGLVLSGDCPPPCFVCSDNCACDAENQAMLAIAHHCKVPAFFIDRYQEPGWEPLDYITEQLRELISIVETKVAGAKPFSEDRLLEIQERERIVQGYLRDEYELCKARPCPIRGKEAFRIPELHFAMRPGGLDYFRAFRDEVKERVEKGVCAIGTEKLRAMWCVTGPFYADGFAPLEKRGVSVPIVLLDIGRSYYGLEEGKIDWTMNGERISPLQQEAKLMMTPAWMGPAERWAQDVITHCRDFHIDAVVYFLQTGCPTTLTSAGIVVDMVKRELGIPVLLMEGWMLDSEQWDEKAFDRQIGDFVEVCLSRKR